MIHLLGVRHHGAGSARSVRAALIRLQPDLVLIEGPPEADGLIAQVTHPDMRLPLAMMVHTPVSKDKEPQVAFYPFAEFSPEWQAMCYAVNHDVPVRFMDLPQAYQMLEPAPVADALVQDDTTDTDDEAKQDAPQADADIAEALIQIRPVDPIGLLAQAAGYQDSERFWEHLVEQQVDASDVFEVLGDAMAAVREHIEHDQPEQLTQTAEAIREARREAWMRKTLREAERKGYQQIVVVCGAWHVPALRDLKTTRKDDTALLKGLPKVKTVASWIAWTHGRLARASGYGAGIDAPGWYAHLWHYYQQADQHNMPVDTEQLVAHWLTRFAHALRADGQDASSAQVIDAIRLIQALVVMRGRQLPDLDDLQEAIVSVLYQGQVLPQPILDQLLIDERLGAVPEGLGDLPLQQDFNQQCKSLRLKIDVEEKYITLDLRTPFDLQKSQFLHQLTSLGLRWGRAESAGQRGSFKETWRLRWQPEDAMTLSEAALWGQTVQRAAHNRLLQRSQSQQDLAQMAAYIEQALLADLTDILPILLERLNNLSAKQHDPLGLIDALTPLVNAERYGSVRQFDTEVLRHVMLQFVVRICISLPSTCLQLNDEVAAQRVGELQQLAQLIDRMDQAACTEAWHEVLARLIELEGVHGQIAGWCCRMAREAELIDVDDARRRFARALSVGHVPEQSAHWFEGFISGQALSLIHDDALWQLVDDWLMQLPEDQLIQLLPLLRRTTASFEQAERQQLAERASQAGGPRAQVAVSGEIDLDRAALTLPLLRTILLAGVAEHV